MQEAIKGPLLLYVENEIRKAKKRIWRLLSFLAL